MSTFYLKDHRGREWQIGEVKGEKVRKKTEKTADFEVKIDGDETDFFLTSLILFATGGRELSPEMTAHAERTLDFIADNLTSLQVKTTREPGAKNGTTGFNWEAKEGKNISKDDVQAAFNNPAALQIFRFIAINPGVGRRQTQALQKAGAIQIAETMHRTRIAEKEKRGAVVKYLEPTIKLTPEERKFERALLGLLREKSDLNRESPDYYTGNGPATTAPAQIFDGETSGQTELRRGAIVCSWAELYKTYTGKPAHQISGKERQLVRELLQRFKVILKPILWKQEIPHSKKVRVFKLEEPLVKQGSTADLTAGELAEVEGGGDMPEEKETLYLILHPAYIAGIKQRAVKWPADYDRRLTLAMGKGKKETTHGARLREYLNGVRCGGKGETELGLAAAVGHSGLERILKKQGANATKAAIVRELEIGKRIRLLEDYKEAQAAGGEVKFVIQFNPDFAN